MKKPLLLVIVISLVFSIDTFSQNNDWLSLSIGGSFPVGAFAHNTNNDLPSGIVDPGGLIDLSYMHPLGRCGFGLTGALRGRFNPIDQSETVPSNGNGNDEQWSVKKAIGKRLR